MNKTLRTLAQAVIVAIGLLGASTRAASAADLVLDCHIRQFQSGGPTVSFTRRFEISDNGYTKWMNERDYTSRDLWPTPDSFGQDGFNFGQKRYGRYVEFSDSRIVIRNDATAYHAIDRWTGAFYAAPRANNNWRMQGHCIQVQSSLDPVTPRRRQF